MDKTTREAFGSAGLLHVLAISGLHVSIIGLAVFHMLSVVLKKRLSAICSIVLIVFYCLYTGMHISTIRASLMLSAYLIKYVVGRVITLKVLFPLLHG